jgi:hypothetical protein
MSGVGILAMILALAALLVMVALWLWTRLGFIVTPHTSGADAPVSVREQELLGQIERIYKEIPSEFRRRYQELIARRDAGTLIRESPEHQELIRMTDELEEWNARRVGLLLELARLRKTPIDEVLREFRHRAVAHG